jgi:hypothetical protein
MKKGDCSSKKRDLPSQIEIRKIAHPREIFLFLEMEIPLLGWVIYLISI